MKLKLFPLKFNLKIFFFIFEFFRGKVVVQDRVARPWLMFSWIYNWTQTSSDEIEQKGRLNAFTKEMIRKRREESENGVVKERVSLLEYMIDINKRHPDFTDEDIIDETCTFMLAVR
jgi:cytochrome P450 family 4